MSHTKAQALLKVAVAINKVKKSDFTPLTPPSPLTEPVDPSLTKPPQADTLPSWEEIRERVPLPEPRVGEEDETVSWSNLLGGLQHLYKAPVERLGGIGKSLIPTLSGESSETDVTQQEIPATPPQVSEAVPEVTEEPPVKPESVSESGTTAPETWFTLQTTDTRREFDVNDIPEEHKTQVRNHFQSLRQNPDAYNNFASDVIQQRSVAEIFSQYQQTRDANKFWGNLEQINPRLAEAFSWMQQVKKGEIDPYKDPKASEHLSELWKFGAYHYATDGFRLDPTDPAQKDTILSRLEKIHLAAMEDGHLDVNDIRLAYNNFAENLSLDPQDYQTKLDFLEWFKSPDVPFLAKAAMVIGLPLTAIGLISGLVHGFGGGTALLVLLGALAAAYGAYQYFQTRERTPQPLGLQLPNWSGAGTAPSSPKVPTTPSAPASPGKGAPAVNQLNTIKDLEVFRVTPENLETVKQFAANVRNQLHNLGIENNPNIQPLLPRLQALANAANPEVANQELAQITAFLKSKVQDSSKSLQDAVKSLLFAKNPQQ